MIHVHPRSIERYGLRPIIDMVRDHDLVIVQSADRKRVKLVPRKEINHERIS